MISYCSILKNNMDNPIIFPSLLVSKILKYKSDKNNNEQLRLPRLFST